MFTETSLVRRKLREERIARSIFCGMTVLMIVPLVLIIGYLVERAALIERLLAFARAEPLLPDRLDIDTLIAGMEDLIARAIGTHGRLDPDRGGRRP